MALRARKASGVFEKRALGLALIKRLRSIWNELLGSRVETGVAKLTLRLFCEVTTLYFTLSLFVKSLIKWNFHSKKWTTKIIGFQSRIFRWLILPNFGSSFAAEVFFFAKLAPYLFIWHLVSGSLLLSNTLSAGLAIWGISCWFSRSWISVLVSIFALLHLKVLLKKVKMFFKRKCQV